jgi:hypothetical protein
MEERIKKQLEMIESGNIEGFLNDIDQMAASKAYLVIRDNISKKHIEMIKGSGKDNYQRFQDIKISAKKSWDYDHRQALILDINRACMNVYTLLLKIMRAHSDSIDEELDKIHIAINRIEEQVGIEPTVWEEPKTDNSTDGGNENVSDVQRVKEST